MYLKPIHQIVTRILCHGAAAAAEEEEEEEAEEGAGRGGARYQQIAAIITAPAAPATWADHGRD